jgi:hypothetical protein
MSPSTSSSSMTMPSRSGDGHGVEFGQRAEQAGFGPKGGGAVGGDAEHVDEHSAHRGLDSFVMFWNHRPRR